MLKNVLLICFLLPVTSLLLAVDYSSCVKVETSGIYQTPCKDCDVKFCIERFECDFGYGPVVLRAICGLKDKTKNICPSITECVQDQTMKIEKDHSAVSSSSSGFNQSSSSVGK